MGRNYLKGHAGDCANALLAAAGYNFGLLLRWLAEILRALFAVLLHSAPMPRFAQISAPPGSLRTTTEASSEDAPYGIGRVYSRLTVIFRLDC